MGETSPMRPIFAPSSSESLLLGVKGPPEAEGNELQGERGGEEHDKIDDINYLSPHLQTSSQSPGNQNFIPLRNKQTPRIQAFVLNGIKIQCFTSNL